MVRGSLFSVSGIALGLLLCAAPAHAQQTILKSSAMGNPEVKSIQAIGFGPQGMLLIGDGQGAQLVVVETGDTKLQPWSKTEVPQVKDKLAARLGTTGKGIEITKLAVNPASQKAYFAIRNLGAKKDLILTMDAAGKVNEFALDNVKHARVSLLAGEKAVKLITDVAWANDRILVTAQADATFGSAIFTVPVPLENNAKQAANSTETYHVAHGRWETQAPIRTVLPYTEKGKTYLVGAFTCTPLVKYSLDDLKPNGKVKGKSVLELGNGNQPQDMFTYEKDGKHYILMATFRKFNKQPVGPSPYWTVRIEQNILNEEEAIDQKAQRRVNSKLEPITDRAAVVPAYHGVVHMGKLDAQRALVVRQEKDGSLTLTPLALP